MKTTDRIFVKILSPMYLWTRNSSLSRGSHTDRTLDKDSGSGPDAQWQRSALSKCSCFNDGLAS